MVESIVILMFMGSGNGVLVSDNNESVVKSNKINKFSYEDKDRQEKRKIDKCISILNNSSLNYINSKGWYIKEGKK